MSNSTGLLCLLLFSSIGLGFFVYGKQQKKAVPLACGILLMLYPYFVSHLLVVILVGVVLSLIPYFFRF